MERSHPTTISSNLSLERRIIEAFQQLQLKTKIISVPLADCILVMPDTELQGHNVNDDIEGLKDTKSWNARFLFTALRCKSRTRSLVNIILVFGRTNDQNVQRFVNGRFGDRLWTYFCISRNLFSLKTS